MPVAIPASRVSSFPVQIDAGCRVLVLGTAPSVRSLAMQESYAHPQNLFWPLMGEMFGAGPELPYAERIARLHARGVGIWDVLKECERAGSLDSNIIKSSEQANDIAALLVAYPTIAAIALNGGRAVQSFRRLVLPRIDWVRADRTAILELPSTSPANASISAADKRARWRAMLDWSA